MIAGAGLDNCLTDWYNVPYKLENFDVDKMQGRCRHSCVTHKDKIIFFGGCFMYNRKRQVRESTNQTFVYDNKTNKLTLINTKGVTPQERKDHTAAVYGNSMIVYGGVL